MKNYIFSCFLLFQAFIFGEGFIAGTWVKTIDGYIPIEQIQPDKKILCYDFSGNVVESAVTRTMSKKAKFLICITLKDGFIPPKNWDGKKVRHPQTGQYGYPDNKGRVWVPTGLGGAAPGTTGNAHGGPHWDVVDKSGKGYENVIRVGKFVEENNE